MGKVSVRVFTYLMQGQVPDWVSEDKVQAWVDSMVSWSSASLEHLKGRAVTHQLISKDEWEHRLREAAIAESRPKIVS